MGKGAAPPKAWKKPFFEKSAETKEKIKKTIDENEKLQAVGTSSGIKRARATVFMCSMRVYSLCVSVCVCLFFRNSHARSYDDVRADLPIGSADAGKQDNLELLCERLTGF